MDWIHLTQGEVQWRELVNRIGFHKKKQWISWLDKWLLTSQWLVHESVDWLVNLVVARIFRVISSAFIAYDSRYQSNIIKHVQRFIRLFPSRTWQWTAVGLTSIQGTNTNVPSAAPVVTWKLNRASHVTFYNDFISVNFLHSILFSCADYENVTKNVPFPTIFFGKLQ
jgi:hypothetical protein